jgi:hemolysin activation/secretion protein
MAKLTTLWIFALAMAFLPRLAFAQTPDLPGSADPSRVERQSPDMLPEIQAPPPSQKDDYSQMVPEGAEKTKIVIRSIYVEGSTVYSAEKFYNIYEELLERATTLDKLYKVTDEITRLYRDDGYILAQAILPPQDLTDGNVKIRVVEPYVARIEESGSVPAYDLPYAILGLLKNGKPFNIKDMERQMLLLNDLPGVQATAVLKPSQEKKKGAIDIEVLFEKKKYKNNAFFNNTGSRYLGPWQAGVTLGLYHDLLVPFQEMEITALVSTPAKELKHFFAKNTFVVSDLGTKFILQGNFTRTRPGYELEPLDVDGTSYSWQASLSHPFLRSRQENLNAHATFDYSHTETSITSTEIFNDNLRSVRIGADYNKTDSWKGSNFVAGEISKGLGILNASDKGIDDLSRAEGNPEYVKFTGKAERLQQINNDFSLYAGTEFQIADSPLLSTEEFGYGGRQYGRAYDSSEITGDDGVSAMMELQYNGLSLTPAFRLQPYAFYDIGKVWNKDRDSEPVSGSSAGAGLRLFHEKGINGDLSIAFPLTKAVGAPNSSNDKNPRFFFSLSFNF